MALRLTSYHCKSSVVDETSGVGWQDPVCEMKDGGRFEGRQWYVHPGGEPFGSTTAVFHASRTDEIFDEDVPELGPETEENTAGSSWQTTSVDGERLLFIQGEFWRDEWFEAGATSPIVTYPPPASSTSFFVDNAGNKMSADQLNDEDVGRWLWFRPGLFQDMVSRRNTSFRWHTRDTFTIEQNGRHVHFGINSVNLLNAYAYDIARLSE